MHYVFAIYIAVTLATGVALLLVWRHDRKQSFTALLGLSHLIWTAYPLSYLAVRNPQAVWQAIGMTGLSLVPSLCQVLLVKGIGQFSGHHVSRRRLQFLFVTLLLAHAAVMGRDLALAQAGSATINLAISLFVVNWLRKQGPGERFTGVLLVLAALNQFNFVFQPGDNGALTQTAIATILRLMLAMALMYAAMTRSAEAGRRVRDRFFLLTDRSPQGSAVLKGEHVVYVNPAFQSIYGMDRVDQTPRVFSPDWLHITNPAGTHTPVGKLLAQVRRGTLPLAEWEGERKALDGRPLYLRYKAWAVEWDGDPALQVVVSDDTAQHEAARALMWHATHDELTGLHNRSALLQRLRDLYDDPAQPAFALILLDVDRFKLFNDAHGPAVGDEVLKALSAQLLKTLGERAELMRLGEDEFALLLIAPDVHVAASQITTDIQTLLTQPLTLSAHRFFLDVSMGVAPHPGVATSPYALLQAANAAMRDAKHLPGTSVQWATEAGRHGLAAFFDAEQALRAGFEKDEFTLVYQPKVAAAGHHIVGFEALVRWDRPGIGRINPMDFIPAAERNGLIVPLGALILTQACRQIARWRDQGLALVPVAVNVSPLQLLDTQFPNTVMKTLAQFQLPAHWLTLEITETAAVAHMDQAREQISQLRQQGVDVALDDFGTGFSSLNMLRSLPLHTVKIDRSLIDPMPDPHAVAVVKAICDLATVLDLEVVAEGVETAAHAQAALQVGCHALQGYHFARPLEVPAATQWLQAHSADQTTALAAM